MNSYHWQMIQQFHKCSVSATSCWVRARTTCVLYCVARWRRRMISPLEKVPTLVNTCTSHCFDRWLLLTGDSSNAYEIVCHCLRRLMLIVKLHAPHLSSYLLIFSHICSSFLTFAHLSSSLHFLQSLLFAPFDIAASQTSTCSLLGNFTWEASCLDLRLFKVID